MKRVGFSAPDDDSIDKSDNASVLPSHTPTQQSSNPHIDERSSSAPSLTHLQTEWPGRTGNGQHLDVRPMTFYELLSSEEYQIVIPLFQRRYCWTTVQIRQWYRDLAEKNTQGGHSTHKTMFKKHYEDATGTKKQMSLMCIDGQQRTTTATLFLMALRAQSRKFKLGELVEKIDAILFQNPSALAGMKLSAKYQAFKMVRNRALDTADADCTAWKAPELEVGWLPPFRAMLVPSFIDRCAYYEILCHDYIREALEEQLASADATTTIASIAPVELELSRNCQNSMQYEAYHLFTDELHSTTTTMASSSACSFLNLLYRRQLHSFSIMYIELLTNDNLQNIFLWMQEKSVFGMGRLLHNPHPGIDFAPIDLARNLVVSSVMDEPLSDQMEFFRRCWVEPLEVRFGYGPRNLSNILHHWVDRVDAETTEDARYKGDMESRIEQFKESVPPKLRSEFNRDKPMVVYARFHSLVQRRALDFSGDPNAITKQVADSIVQDMIREGRTMGL